MKKIIYGLLCVPLLAGAVEETFKPEWGSLSKHEAAPEWLKDAKLGIYFHWGPYSVPAYKAAWYPRWMHFDSEEFADFNRREVFDYHRETYGHPSEFGYHDFVPMFTAEHFDPEDWAELFKQSGARFAGPVAEHHDGFAMWDSELTPWNAMDRGPGRDILGELFQSLEKREVKTIATFHHARNLQRYAETWEQEKERTLEIPRKYCFDSHFPYMPGMPTASEDPELRMLYGNMPEGEWCEDLWLGKLKEVVDAYQPDIVWFDSWLDQIPESYRKRFCSYYLNAAENWDRDVAIVRKEEDLPLAFTVNDHEKSREPNAQPELWMSDDTLSTYSWSYTEGMVIKPLADVLHSLIDIVSKNGVLLLNVSPKADGTIPQDQREVLLAVGDWLEQYGEAIYGTRPWKVAAEGPTSAPPPGLEHYEKFLKMKYTAKDIRYTASKDGKTVYAMTLGRPKDCEPVLLKNLGQEYVTVAKVESLSGEEVEWKPVSRGLRIVTYNVPESAVALAFKITLK